MTSYAYDAYGNLATKTEPLGQAYVYFADGRLESVTSSIGVTKTYAYYDNGLTKQITDTGSSGTTYVDEQDAYDSAGDLTAQVTKNGTLTTNRAVDAMDRTVTTTVDPSGLARVTALTYDADSHVLTSTETDAAGDPKQQWTYTYDAAGDKTSAAEYATSSTTLTTTWQYDERGLKLTATDPGGHVYDYTNDETGRLAITTAPSITTTSSTGTTATTAPTTLVGYDTFGDKTEAEDARGDITVTAYDKDGRKTATTLPSYTAPGSSTAISATTAWTYDAAGDELTATDALGNKTTYAYDQLGDQVSKTNPAINESGTATQGTWTYAYDLAGDKLTATDPYGAVTHYVFDDLDRAWKGSGFWWRIG